MKKKPNFKFKPGRRKAMRIAQEELIRTRFLDETAGKPLVIEPSNGSLDLVDWARDNRDYLAKEVDRHGGVLLRGFHVPTIDDFESFVAASSSAALKYTERSSPRSKVSGNIYTSTDYPPEHEIFLHNEQSYNLTFPLRIYFYCVTVPGDGGQTPIADSRKVFARLPADVRRRFEEQGYLYVRNFAEGMGLVWQEVFQTSDKAEVEAYCQANRIDFEWVTDDHLRTRQLRRARAEHPRTGEPCWFNHLTFFHVSTLPDAIREPIESGFAEEDLPNNTYYGDGSPIEPEVLATLRQIYRDETVVFDWQQHDVLMLDNMLCSHGRRPFSGARKIVAGMSEPFLWDDIPA